MKARRKGTNNPFVEIGRIQLENSDILYSPDVIEFEGQPEDFPTKEEILDDTYWQEVRNSAAIAAMQGIMSNPNCTFTSNSMIIIPQSAVEYADALIKELQKK